MLPGRRQRRGQREPIRLGAAPGADRRRTTSTARAITFRRTARARAESVPAPRSGTPAWPARGSSGKSNRNCMVHLSGLCGSPRTPPASGPAPCAAPVVRHRAAGYEDVPRRAVPLMQLRIEGASVASPLRTAALATGYALPRSTARQRQGIEAGLRSVSLNSPPLRGVPRTTFQVKSPRYDTGVQYQSPIWPVNSAARFLCELLTPSRRKRTYLR